MAEEKLLEMMADLLFAYINKDDDYPHGFEFSTIGEVSSLLLDKYKGDKYSKEFFQSVSNQMNEKRKELYGI